MSVFQHSLAAALLSLALASCAATSSREPANLSTAKINVKAYLDNGAYQRDITAVSVKAKSWIENRATKGGGRLAVVFDIDETVLSNLSHMQEEDWGYQMEIWDKWVARSSAPAITPMREVYQSAITRNVTVFFITGRRDREKAATARNLRSQGMGTYAALITKPNDFPFRKPAAQFKAPARETIQKSGYTIIASIGDQQSDLDGGFAEKTFKLPNPFYLIP